MYAKVFRSLWDGTLGPDWQAWSVFVFLLAHADLEGFVDMTPQAISGRSGIPLEDVARGLARLEAADPNSRSQELDGRRLERIDGHRSWGWRIVNYQHYRSLRDEETVRAQNRDRQRKLRSRSVTDGNASSRRDNATSRHADVDVEADTSKHLSDQSDESANGSQPKPRPKKPHAPEPDPPGFRRFYAAFPRHDRPRTAAKAFAQARKRHPSLDDDDFENAARSFTQRCESEAREPRFIPMPTTWLNGDSFMEEFADDD
jgi:hypothetical protein